MSRPALPTFLGEVVDLPRARSPNKSGWLAGGAGEPPRLVPGFAMEPQARTEWCWAAVTQAVLRTGGRGMPQCEVASGFLGKACCTDGGAENRPKKLGDVLTHYQVLAGSPQGELSEASVVAEIDGRRTFCIELQWYESGRIRAHVVAVAGYTRRADGTFVLMIGDPAFGGQLQEADLVSFAYQGAAWGYTYKTHSGARK